MKKDSFTLISFANLCGYRTQVSPQTENLVDIHLWSRLTTAYLCLHQILPTDIALTSVTENLLCRL